MIHKKYSQLHVISITFLLTSSLIADPRITFFFNSYRSAEHYAQKLMTNLKNPKKLAKYKLKTIFERHQTAGIIALYAGYVQISDRNGQISFPRKQIKPQLTIVVTQEIIPIIIFGNTIAHWHLSEHVPAVAYSINFETDEKIGVTFYNTSCAGPLPHKNHIPADTLIILADPKNIIIPIGITMAKKDPNLILPPMYVKKGIDVLKNGLFFLTISPFFSKPTSMHEQKTDRILSISS